MALTKTPIELSSTPGIVDNSNATAITIDSSENVTLAGTATAVGLTVTSSSSNAGTFKAVGGYALQAYQDATSADHTALELRSDHVSGGTNRYLIRGYNTAAGTPVESFNVNTAGGATFSSDVAVTGSATLGTSSVGTNNTAPTALVLRHQSDQTSGFDDDFGVGMKFNVDARNGGYATFAQILATQKGTGYQLRFRVGSTEAMTIDNSGYIHSLSTYGLTTGSSANMFIASDGSFQRSTSSLRYKNTVNDATHGLTELLTLRPVTYKGNNDGDLVFGGLIAEEVHDAGLTEFVQYNDEDEPDALAYGNMVSLCIKAIQELKEELNTATARITELENN